MTNTLHSSVIVKYRAYRHPERTRNSAFFCSRHNLCPSDLLYRFMSGFHYVMLINGFGTYSLTSDTCVKLVTLACKRFTIFPAIELAKITKITFIFSLPSSIYSLTTEMFPSCSFANELGLMYFTVPLTVPYLLYGYTSSSISASIPISTSAMSVFLT